LLILKIDAHPGFHIGTECKDYLAKHNYPRAYRLLTSLDQHLEHFTQKLQEIDLDRNAEVVIDGDHLTMGDRNKRILGHRNLTVFMPLLSKDNRWARARFERTANESDFASTIMNLSEIHYEAFMNLELKTYICFSILTIARSTLIVVPSQNFLVQGFTAIHEGLPK
jgi:hypothetical protein